MQAKPFIKWAGGKGQLLEQLKEHFPAGLENEIDTYVEPFVGGGAVLFYVLQNYNIKQAYIFDINKELINTYRCIKENVAEVIKELRVLERDYKASEDKQAFFYTVRDKYNTIQLNGRLDFEKASRFIFLNRTCYNGLYRVNANGGFNVPFGKYKNPTICDEQNLLAVSKLLQKVEIIQGSYEQAEEFCIVNTFVYFDPPYRPLVASFNYAADGFGDREQKELAEFYKKLDKKGCKLLLSNSDPKNTNPDDNFFDELYKPFTIDRIHARRMINCQADKRGNVTEILVRNYAKK